MHPINGSVGQHGQNVPLVGFGVDPVQLGGFGQRHDGRPLAAGVGPGEQPVLAAERQRLDGTLDRVIVDGERPVVDLAGQRRPARECVADATRQVTAPGHAGQRQSRP